MNCSKFPHRMKCSLIGTCLTFSNKFTICEARLWQQLTWKFNFLVSFETGAQQRFNFQTNAITSLLATFPYLMIAATNVNYLKYVMHSL